VNLGKPTPGPRKRRPRRPRRDDDPERTIEALRRVMLKPDRERIDVLEHRPPVSAATVGDVLPEAIARSTGARSEELGIALEPAVTLAIGAVAEHRPEFFGEILAPTIGAAVRKAVAAAFAMMLERFNVALERSLSVRSIRWRIEAARTGRPFAEVVLLRTMQYRVEQVFVIHTSTSLVLQHVVDASLDAPAPDQVAAMLSAIDTFGRDALSPGADDEHVDRIQIGDRAILVSRSPLVSLAVVVRGSPTTAINAELSECRERLSFAFQAELGRFHGDVAPFASSRPMLEPLLRTEVTPAPRRAHIWLAVAALVATICSIALVWRSQVRHEAAARYRASVVSALASEPGFLVTSADWDRGTLRVSGLRDPLAPAPEVVFARHGLPPPTTDLGAFISLDPRVLHRRVERALAPPPSVSLALSDGALEAKGVAARAWIRDARLLARSLVGVERYDDHELRAAEDMALRDAATALESVTLSFAPDDAAVGAAHAAGLAAASEATARVVRSAGDAQAGVCIEVIGHADTTGANERNLRLSEARATAVAARLEAFGIPRSQLRARGEGAWDAPGLLARSVTFQVDTSATSSGCRGVR
jgi:hypothetical protein